MPQAIGPILAFAKGAITAYTTWAAAHPILAAGVKLAATAALQSVLGPNVPDPEGGKINFRQPLPPRRYLVGRSRCAGVYHLRVAKDNVLQQVLSWPETGGAALSRGRTWLNDDVVSVLTVTEGSLVAGRVRPLADGRYGLSVVGAELGAVNIERRQGLLTETSYSGLTADYPAWPTNARGDGIPSTWLRCTNGKLENFTKQFPAGAPELNEELFAAAYDWRDEAQDKDDRSTWQHTRNPVVWGVNILWRVYGADWGLRFAPALDVLTIEANACDELVERVYSTGVLTEDALPGATELVLSSTLGLDDGATLTAGGVSLTALDVIGDTVTVAALDEGFPAGAMFQWPVAGTGIGEARYEVGFVANYATPPAEFLQVILDSMSGWFGVRRDGAFIFRAGRNVTPTVIFGDEEVSDFTYEPGPGRDEAVNSLTVSFTDPDAGYVLVETTQRQDEADIAARGQERTGSFSPKGVQSNGQAGRLALVALQRGLAARGTVRTPLSARRGLGERVIGLRISDEADLNDVTVEIVSVEVSLETASIVWSWRTAPDFAWDPDEQEGEGPTTPPPPLPGADDLPTIDTVEVFFDDAGSPRLRVTAFGPERDDLTWRIGYRVAGDTAFIESTAADLDPLTPVLLETGLVPQGDLEVIVGYQTGGGTLAWMDAGDAVAVNTLSPTALDPATEALLAAFTTPADDTRAGLYNDLVTALKSAGVWSKLDMLYVLAAHDSQAAGVNVVDPVGTTMTVSGAPVFTADYGYTGDGVDDYLDTGRALDALPNLSQNSASAGVWVVASGATATHALWGKNTDGFRASLTLSGNVNARINDAANLTMTGVGVSQPGFYALNRSGPSARQGFKDGAQTHSDTQASTALVSENLWFMRLVTSYGALPLGAAFAGGSLTATEHAALHSALNDYLTAVGAI